MTTLADVNEGIVVETIFRRQGLTTVMTHIQVGDVRFIPDRVMAWYPSADGVNTVVVLEGDHYLRLSISADRVSRLLEESVESKMKVSV